MDEATGTPNSEPENETREVEDPEILLDDILPSSGLLSFYDRLRDRIVRFLERRGGRLGAGLAETLMIAPDTFMLIARLALDKRVPKSTRRLFGSALAYFVLPIDLLPEMFVGPVGYVDDVVLALAVLQQSFSADLEPYARQYWSGPEPVRTVLRDVLGAANSLLGADLYGRLRDALSKKGIDLDQEAADAKAPN